MAKADKTAGVFAKAAKRGPTRDTSLPKLTGDTINPTFSITYLSGTDKKRFNFALLPAVEPALQYSANGSLKGQVGVPEVKPGLMSNLTMKYKNFLVPGGAPVVQTIGISQKTHQLVGAFIGTENTAASEANRPSLNSSEANAFFKANEFAELVVQTGRPVSINISADVNYSYEGVILSFKYYTVRAERVYYVLDILATKYNNRAVK